MKNNILVLERPKIWGSRDRRDVIIYVKRSKSRLVNRARA